MNFWNPFNQYSVGFGLGSGFGAFFQNISRACDQAGLTMPTWTPPPNWSPGVPSNSGQTASMPAVFQQGFYTAIQNQAKASQPSLEWQNQMVQYSTYNGTGCREMVPYPGPSLWGNQSTDISANSLSTEFNAERSDGYGLQEGQDFIIDKTGSKEYSADRLQSNGLPNKDRNKSHKDDRLSNSVILGNDKFSENFKQNSRDIAKESSQGTLSNERNQMYTKEVLNPSPNKLSRHKRITFFEDSDSDSEDSQTLTKRLKRIREECTSGSGDKAKKTCSRTQTSQESTAQQKELAKKSVSEDKIPLTIIDNPSKTQFNLRPVAIDGANVAFAHGKNKFFSTSGIFLAVEYFKPIGSNIKVFLPSFRRSVMENIIPEDLIVYTPIYNKKTGKNVVCYDDRFILEYAQKSGAVIVSNDTYRDLVEENTIWEEIIEKRLLKYTFADDIFMVPRDPNGRGEPNLDSFLMF